MIHSFEEVCVLEPRVKALMESIPKRMSGNPRQFWQEWSRIKSDMTLLVGWSARNPAVNSCPDYETAYGFLFAVASRFDIRQNKH